MSEQDARFQTYANVGTNPAHEGKDTRFLAYSNIGINPVHEGKMASAQAHMNVGMGFDTVIRLLSQRGWGIPLAPERDIKVLSQEAQARFHQYVEVSRAISCANGTPVMPPEVSAPYWENIPGSSSSAYQVDVTWQVDIPADGAAVDWCCYVIIEPPENSPNDAGQYDPAGYGNDNIDPESMPLVGFNWSGFTAVPGTIGVARKKHDPAVTGAAGALVSYSQYSGYDPLPPTVIGNVIGAGFYVIQQTSFPSLNRQLPQHDGQGGTLGLLGVTDPDQCCFYWGPQIAITGDIREVPLGPL